MIDRRREELRGKVLLKALKAPALKQARAARSWPQRDRLSAQWLLALPAFHTHVESELFAEAVAAQLCLPSLVCKGRLGEVVGKKGGRVDPFGDVVQAAQLEGDAFRTRHDRLKMLITRLCEWCGMGVQPEVLGLFAHPIPREVLQFKRGGAGGGVSKREEEAGPSARLQVEVSEGVRG